MPVDHSTQAAAGVELSVTFPILDEEGSMPELIRTLVPVLDGLGRRFEVFAVNDGSTNRSQSILEAHAARLPRPKVIEFLRNAGQTAALTAGIDYSPGETIVTPDADLQNDPLDIPRLLDKLDEGHDVVSGWRKDRKDARIRGNFLSRMANCLISLISGVGCTIMAARQRPTARMC